MLPKTKVYITLAVIILLVAVLYFFSSWFSQTTGFVVGEDEKTKLAQCLSAKGAFFGSDLNKETLEQKKDFGAAAFKFVRYEDCSQNPGLCKSLDKIPAWVVNGTILYGKQSLKELAEVSGCEY